MPWQTWGECSDVEARALPSGSRFRGDRRGHDVGARQGTEVTERHEIEVVVPGRAHEHVGTPIAREISDAQVRADPFVRNTIEELLDLAARQSPPAADGRAVCGCGVDVPGQP